MPHLNSYNVGDVMFQIPRSAIIDQRNKLVYLFGAKLNLVCRCEENSCPHFLKPRTRVFKKQWRH